MSEISDFLNSASSSETPGSLGGVDILPQEKRVIEIIIEIKRAMAKSLESGIIRKLKDK